MLTVFEDMAGVRTPVKAESAPDAQGRRERKLRPPVPSLGVVAPQAFERTSLQEHSRPDAGPIVDRHPLDVEHHPPDVSILRGVGHVAQQGNSVQAIARS